MLKKITTLCFLLTLTLNQIGTSAMSLSELKSIGDLSNQTSKSTLSIQEFLQDNNLMCVEDGKAKVTCLNGGGNIFRLTECALLDESNLICTRVNDRQVKVSVRLENSPDVIIK